VRKKGWREKGGEIDFSPLLISSGEAITAIPINRPQQTNALDQKTIRELKPGV